MVTRVRIDAEGDSRDEVEAHLNGAFQLLFQNSVAQQFVFTGPAYQSMPYGPAPVVPRESEFVEEVYESAIRDSGAIYWKGRRTLRFIENIMMEASAPDFTPLQPSPTQCDNGDDLSQPPNT